ncbi:spindle checkpoint protein [Cytidiella melzeri]|nr:spindle checkpoint protein [Cytidiella melzeri]
MSLRVTPLTFNQTVKGITDFIEVAIHTILYVRQVYPAELFVRRKKYNTPVFQSRHPLLNEYISGAVKAVKEELVLGNVDKVTVVIKSSSEDIAVENAMAAATLGQYFRSFLVKLCMIESQLGPLELHADDISFAIVLELNDNKAPSATHDKEPPPWIPASVQHTTSGASGQAELHMIRAVDTGIINLSLAVQESEQKLNMIQESEQNDVKGKGRAQ